MGIFSVVVLVLSGCSMLKFGKQDQSQIRSQENIQKGNPPAEATSVCEGKSEGDSCEIAMPQKNGASGEKSSGTCKKAPKGDSLACMPDNMPSGGNNPGGNGGGPQQSSPSGGSAPIGE